MKMKRIRYFSIVGLILLVGFTLKGELFIINVLDTYYVIDYWHLGLIALFIGFLTYGTIFVVKMIGQPSRKKNYH